MPAEHANQGHGTLGPFLSRILVPIDFTDRSTMALRYASALATTSTEILLLHVVDPAVLGQKGPTCRQVWVDRSILVDCELHLRELRDHCIPPQERSRIYVRQGNPEGEILRLANEEEADLIVLTTNDQRSGDRPFGRTADAVARRSLCPVLTVREDMQHLPR